MKIVMVLGLVAVLMFGGLGCAMFEDEVEVTLPPDMFEGEDMDEIIAEAEEEGMSVVEEHEDGSITYAMPSSVHSEMMEEIEEDIQEQIEDVKVEYASVEDVSHAADFAEFTLVVDQEAYETSFDGFAAFELGLQGMFYQMFDGVGEEDIEVKVHLENVDTGEEFDTIVYPEAMDDTMEPEEDIEMIE